MGNRLKCFGIHSITQNEMRKSKFSNIFNSSKKKKQEMKEVGAEECVKQQ
jgi:hypothetical protein